MPKKKKEQATEVQEQVIDTNKIYEEKIDAVLFEKMCATPQSEIMLKLKENLSAKAKARFRECKEQDVSDETAYATAIKVFDGLDMALGNISGTTVGNQKIVDTEKYVKYNILTQIAIWTICLAIFLAIGLSNMQQGAMIWFIAAIPVVLFFGISFVAHRVFKSKRQEYRDNELFRD